MFPTRIDAPERARAVALLNAHLADAIDLHSQTRFAHRNVKRPHFAALHRLFDERAETVAGHIDEVAERAAALGGTAAGTARQAAGASRVPEFPVGLANGAEVVAVLADRFGGVTRTARAAIGATDELGDTGTADLFTAVSRDLDRALYFLEAHLNG